MLDNSAVDIFYPGEGFQTEFIIPHALIEKTYTGSYKKQPSEGSKNIVCIPFIESKVHFKTVFKKKFAFLA